MSRNLCRTNCAVCRSAVTLDAGTDNFVREHLPYRYVVRDATCTVCGAKYLAWTWPAQDGYGNGHRYEQHILKHGFYDLSYRSTFNDEPGPDDLPAGKVEVYRLVVVDGEEHRFPLEDVT